MTRRGFTFVELLMATALLALLMVGVLAVVVAVAKPVTATDAKPDAALQVVQTWGSLLRDDLDQAVGADVTKPDELTMLGYSSLQTSDRRRVHRPVLITYRFEEVDGRKWLVRRQAALDMLNVHNVQRDLVCQWDGRFELQPTGDASAVAQFKSLRNPGPATVDLATERAGPMGGAGVLNASADSPVQTERRSYFWQPAGLSYFYEFLPTDARGSIDPDEAEKAAEEAQAAAAASVADAPVADRIGKSARTRRRLGWRLKVWMSGAAEPVYDQVLTVR
jgi:prepilin-type N-terminal cleavage/methylation domain-containing protein